MGFLTEFRTHRGGDPAGDPIVPGTPTPGSLVTRPASRASVPPAPAPAAVWPPTAQGAPPPPVQPAPRRRRPSTLTIAIVALVEAIIAVLAVAFLPSQTPWVDRAGGQQILQQSLAAATRAGTAHVQMSNTGAGPDVTGSIDFSPSGGVETATMGTQTMTVEYIGGSLYMRGDPGLLMATLKLPAAAAARFGGRWLSLPIDNQYMRQMAGQMQTSVVVSDLLSLAGPVAKASISRPGRVTLEGRLADNRYNRGSGAGDPTALNISDKAPYYPMSISYSDPQNGSTRMTFSRWGERLDLTPPRDAVPLGQVVTGDTNVLARPTGSNGTAPAIARA